MHAMSLLNNSHKYVKNYKQITFILSRDILPFYGRIRLVDTASWSGSTTPGCHRLEPAFLYRNISRAFYNTYVVDVVFLTDLPVPPQLPSAAPSKWLLSVNVHWDLFLPVTCQSYSSQPPGNIVGQLSWRVALGYLMLQKCPSDLAASENSPDTI